MLENYKPFIKEQLQLLAQYDDTRPTGHIYPFPAHCARVANDMRSLATAMGMSAEKTDALYNASLVHDIGKRLLPAAIWDTDDKPDDALKALRRKHTQNGVDIVNDVFGADNNDAFVVLMRDLMAHHHEAMDGSGFLGLKGDQLSLEARMLCVCDAFDGYSVWRPHFNKRDISPEGVIARMRFEKNRQFDSTILDVFERLKVETARAHS